MRRTGLTDIWRGGPDRAILPRARGFGTSRTVLQRLSGVLSPESLFRLVLAFVLATALWLYVNARNGPNAAFAYPQPITVSAENVPHGLTVRNSIHPVHVRVRPVVAGLAVPPSDFVATVDLYGLHAGIHKHVPVHLSWDPSVPVVNYSPRSVLVDLQRVITKSVPVQVHAVGSPPYGYALKRGSLFVTPESIRVSGPKTFVRQVVRAVVDVGLDTARSSVNVSYTPTLENAQRSALPRGGAISPQRVRVHAVIQQLASYKTLPILVTIRGQPATGFGVTSIRVNPSGLTAHGSTHALSHLKALRTASIRVARLRAGSKTFHVRLRTPKGVYTPTRFEHVRVTVTVGPVSGAASTRVPVAPVAVTPGDTAGLSPASVLVTFSGPSPSLQSVGKHLQATVNLAGLGPGTYTLRPMVTGPKGVGIDSILPGSVTVTIRPSS